MRSRLSAIVAFLLSATAAVAHAQATVQTPDPNRCFPVQITRVDVRLKDDTTARGTLVCLGPEQAVIAGTGGPSTFQMSEVKRISKPPDPVWDGALKGAGIGAALMLFCLGDCNASVALRAVGAYALAGAIVDSVDPHTDVLYRSPSKGMSVRYRWKF